MPVFNIHHITKYEYDRPVKESVNEIKIYPFADSTQETLHHQVNITGQPDIFMIQDYWGNQYRYVQPDSFAQRTGNRKQTDRKNAWPSTHLLANK